MNNKQKEYLDQRIKDKIEKHECICEPELLDRISDIFMEISMFQKEIEDDWKNAKQDTEHIREFLEKRISSSEKKVPKFDVGYVVVASDNHVVENRVFDKKEDADKLAKEYDGQCPSFVDNSYTVMKVCSDCLQYGAFPYEDKMYFIYDIDQI